MGNGILEPCEVTKGRESLFASVDANFYKGLMVCESGWSLLIFRVPHIHWRRTAFESFSETVDSSEEVFGSSGDRPIFEIALSIALSEALSTAVAIWVYSSVSNPNSDSVSN